MHHGYSGYPTLLVDWHLGDSARSGDTPNHVGLLWLAKCSNQVLGSSSIKGVWTFHSPLITSWRLSRLIEPLVRPSEIITRVSAHKRKLRTLLRKWSRSHATDTKAEFSAGAFNTGAVMASVTDLASTINASLVCIFSGLFCCSSLACSQFKFPTISSSRLRIWTNPLVHWICCCKQFGRKRASGNVPLGLADCVKQMTLHLSSLKQRFTIYPNCYHTPHW